MDTTAEELNQKGLIEIENRNFSQAEEYFAKAYQLENNVSYLFDLIDILIQNNKFTEAMGHIINAKNKIGLDNTDKEFLMSREAIVEFKLKNYETAKSLATSILKNNENDTVSIKVFADSCYYMSHITQAIQAYEYILERTFNCDSCIKLADLYHKTDEIEKAIEIMAQACGVIKNQPEIFYLYGLYLGEKNYICKAIDNIKAAISIDNTKLKYYLQLINLNLKESNISEAIRLFKSIENTFQNNIDYHIKKCEIYSDNNLINELDAALRNVPEEFKYNPEIIHYVAFYQEKLGNLSEAVNTRLNLINANPNSNTYSVNLYCIGDLYEQKNNYIEAFNYYQQANSYVKENFNCDNSNYKQYFNKINESIQNIEINKAKNLRQNIFILGMPCSGVNEISEQIKQAPSFSCIKQNILAKAILKTMKKHSLDTIFDLITTTCQDTIASLADYFLDIVNDLTNITFDKTLVNTHELDFINLPLVKKAFPNAKIIFLIREPLDVIINAYKTNYFHGSIYDNFLCLENAIGFYRDAMSLYLNYKNYLNLNVFEVKIEELRTNTNILNTILDTNIQNLTETSISKWQNYGVQLKNYKPHLKAFYDHFNYEY